MMRALLAAALLVVACGDAPAHPAASPHDERQKQRTSAEHCVLAAKECGRHATDGKTEALVDCMPPEVVENIGGRAKLLDMLKRSEEERTKDGFQIEESVVLPPTQMRKGTTHTFAVLPQTVGVKVPEGRLVLESYLLGISTDDGKSWRFIDGVELDRAAATELFPDLPAALTFPVVKKPELQPTSAPAH